MIIWLLSRYMKKNNGKYPTSDNENKKVPHFAKWLFLRQVFKFGMRHDLLHTLVGTFAIP